MLRRRDPHDGRSIRLVVLAIGALGLVGALAVLTATASGLGVSPDGVSYLSLADEFRTDGSPYPVLAPSPTHYAPLWPVLVGGAAAVTDADDLLGVGRYLNAILAATIPALVFLAVRRSPAAPAWWSVVAAAVVTFSFGLFRLSARALTEPLFIVLMLATLLLLEVGAHRRSRAFLIGAAAVAAMTVLTRFAGAVLLVPIVVVAWRCAPTIRRRVVDIATVTVVTLAPTALWALAAPRTTTSGHLDAATHGGLDEVVDSIVEAGHALVAPPSTGFADPLYLILGIVTLAAPFVAAAVLVWRRSSNDSGSDASRLRTLDSSGLLVWLGLLVAYTALIAAQRWWIDREIIDRYWVPYVVITVVVVARVVADIGLLRTVRTRRIVVAIACLLAVVNVALVMSFVVERVDRGIELNEARYQDTELFDLVAESGVDEVITDSTRLVELHLVLLDETDVVVRDVGCQWSGESNAVAMAEASTGPTAVVLTDVCDRESTRVALADIPGVEVISDPEVGTVALIDGT